MGESMSKTPYANTYVAYVCWVLSGCGLLGGHQFYLGDDNKAFLYLTSLGGFGLAAVRDLWTIPSYCRDDEAPPKKKSFFLLVGAVAFAYYYARILAAAYLGFARASLKGDYWVIPLLLRACGAALGARLVLTSGNRTNKMQLWMLAVISFVAQLIIVLLPSMDTIRAATYIPSPATVAAFVPAVVGYKYRQYGGRARGTSRGLLMRTGWLAGGVTVFVYVAAFAFLYNAHVVLENTNGEGTTVERSYLIDADLEDVSWQELLEYAATTLMGLDEVSRFSLDFVDESDAFETLGLKEGASMREVKKRFRQLAREMHPDKHPAGDKAEVEKRFATMQAAYTLLIDKYGRTVEDQNKIEL